jgi:serine/threonine-protein kinase
VAPGAADGPRGLQRPAAERRRPHPRGIAIAALAATALVAGVAVGANHGGSPSHRSSATISAARHAAVAKAAKPHSHRHSPAGRTHASATGGQGGSASQSGASGGSATSGGASGAPSAAVTGGSADALEARGHQLMLAGQYSEATGVLRQAVAAAPRGSLTYAYALYDLGRSLRLAGDPAAAVPILRTRLQIPNQTDVVRHELDLALQALGGASGGAAPAPSSGGGAPVAPAKDAGGGKHDGPGQGKHKHGGD